jgi:D-glycero-alpha-D-manno-heptose 1-phosphate guanylyltransferase
MQALILAGGFGTRLRSVVSDRPKCMALVENRPFLEYIIRMLHRRGCDEFIVSTGYMAETISGYFGAGTRLDVAITYSHETEPLGTGGAIRLAEPMIHDMDFIVANGDSLIEADVPGLIACRRKTAAPVAIALLAVSNAGRYGTVELEPDGRITRFAEKVGRAEPGIINGGVYACSTDLFQAIPSGRAVSLEREVFPGLLGKGVYGMIGKSYFTDIGLPEDYARAQELPQDLKRIAGIE